MEHTQVELQMFKTFSILYLHIGCDRIADIPRTGSMVDEERILNAKRFVKTWNNHDALLENLLLIIRLLCHPGCHVKAKDIEQAKKVIADTGMKINWGI